MSEQAAASWGFSSAKINAERKGSLRRGIYLLPSIFTVGTLVCGFFAILSVLKGIGLLSVGIGMGLGMVAFDNAAKAIGWAIVFDGLDDRIARLTNSASDFGREFDSLADVVAFGVAPACLAYAWCARFAEGAEGLQLAHHVRQVGWLVAFAFLICGAARLARFNIESRKPTGDRRYFVGLPIPAAAGVIAAVVHWSKVPPRSWEYAVVWLGMVAILALLMISRIRYFSFKTFDLRRRRPYLTVIIMGLCVWAIAVYSEPVLLLMALSYALSGPLGRLTSRFRSHPPTPEEVHAT